LAGLLLGAVQVGDIDRKCRAPSSNGAAAWCSTANVASVMLTAELMMLMMLEKAVVDKKWAVQTIESDGSRIPCIYCLHTLLNY